MHSDFVHAVAYSPDGKYLASASKDRAVRLTEADTGKGVFTFADRDQDVLAVAFGRDGKSVVASGLQPGLSWWDTATGARIRSAGGHRGAVHELAFSRDGRLLASAGEDGTVKLWNGATGALVRSLAVGSLVYACALSADGKLAAAGSFDGLVRLYDAGTGALRATLLSVRAGEKPGWLLVSPAGYAAGDEALLAQARWKMGAREVPAGAVWKALGKPDLAAKALGGASVPAPVFE
jgi:WD40 repeat protein